MNGKVDPDEILNQSQSYITTAGYKSTFSYDKMIQILCQSIARPEQAIVLGGSLKTPMMEGLLSKSFISDLRLDGGRRVSAVKVFSLLLGEGRILRLTENPKYFIYGNSVGIKSCIDYPSL